jgi:hypothetical protein
MSAFRAASCCVLILLVLVAPARSSHADDAPNQKQKTLLAKLKKLWKTQADEITRTSISLRRFNAETKKLARKDVNDAIDLFQRSGKSDDFPVLIRKFSSRQFRGRAPWGNLRIFQEGSVIKEEGESDHQYKDLTTHLDYSKLNRTAVLYAARTSRLHIMTYRDLRFVPVINGADAISVVGPVKKSIATLRITGKSLTMDLKVDVKTGACHRFIIKNSKGVVIHEVRQFAWHKYGGKLLFPSYFIETRYAPDTGRLQSAELNAIESATFNKQLPADALKVRTKTKINVIDKRDPMRTRSMIGVPPTDDLMARIRAKFGY